MHKAESVKMIIWAVIIAGVLTAAAASGLLDKADLSVSDTCYQSRKASDGEIVLIGIDQRALEEIGPYGQWGRDIIAMALEALNESEECRPAAIGIDVLYVGETQEEADEWLVEAAGQYGNVVTACSMEIEDGIVEDEEAGLGYYLDNSSVAAFVQPFDALRDVTEQGHINAMMDTDGILRHHLLYMDMPDGQRIPSFVLALAEKYYDYHGLGDLKLPPTDKRGFWYVPFCGIPGDFDSAVSVVDLLSGAVSAEQFDGKIVLIGAYATGLQDSYVTASDHSQTMYGVEYQANAIQALLWGDYKKEVGEPVQLAVLFLVLLVSILGFWRRPVWASTILWVFLSGGYVLFCKGMYGIGLVLHVLWIPLGVTVLYIGCIVANYNLAARERRQVTRTFKRYVAPEIVNEILAEGTKSLELGGKLTNIAVLFVDVRGFTPMSELLEPTQVVEILNRYLTLISECILRNGGTLDKFVGDAAMAFWGAPLPQKDYVMHAVQAAADMVEGSKALSAELLERYGRTVSFGIGIHTGAAVVGNIGSPERMDYTAIGDTVNTASRLEANAPGGTIYISRAVADALEGRINVTSLGDSIRLKGKKEGFEILTMDGIRTPPVNDVIVKQ